MLTHKHQTNVFLYEILISPIDFFALQVADDVYDLKPVTQTLNMVLKNFLKISVVSLYNTFYGQRKITLTFYSKNTLRE